MEGEIDFSKAESVRKPSGTILFDSGQCADTVQCVHCHRHWVVIRGSGRKRGFCMNCGGVTCGSDKCHQCIPREKRIALFEQGKIDSL